ncbi:unnamed protein product, partial [Prunus brigantina]
MARSHEVCYGFYEEIYMDQPKGFISKHEEKKVCKLQRSIYGLTQASRSRNIHFDEAVKGYGFHQNEDEPCMLTSMKLWLSKTFSMKDLGNASYILGIKIYRDRSRKLIGLSQSLYVDKVLGRFQIECSNKGFLLVGHGIHLFKSMGPKTLEVVLQMSRISYAMLCTRPDISYAMSITSRYQSNPGSEHWSAVKTVLKYLRKTKDMFIVYGGNPELLVEGNTYSDFESDVDDRKSTHGHVFTLNGGAINWRCCKQSTTADSTTE